MISALDLDALASVIDSVASDDLLPLALVCKVIYGLSRSRAMNERDLPRPLWVTCGTTTLARASWAVEVMGATPTARWCTYAARHGHTDVLKWMMAKGVACDEHAMVAAALWG